MLSLDYLEKTETTEKKVIINDIPILLFKINVN